MKVQLKEEAPDRVEVGLGPRVYLFERGQEPVELRASDWPELERQGYFELVPEEPAEVVIEVTTTEAEATETAASTEGAAETVAEIVPPADATLETVDPDQEAQATRKKK